MTGIDRFLSTALSNRIKKNLNVSELKRIEKDLFFSDGMSVKLSMEHFEKFHLRCKKIRSDSTAFEEKCFNQICKIEQSNKYTIIKIIDEELINTILQFFGDNDIKKILKLVMKKEKTIPEILDECNIPKTSAYRKIENLIISGIIIETRKVISESKKISKYQCIFEQLQIILEPDRFTVKGHLFNKAFLQSSIIKKIFKDQL